MADPVTTQTSSALPPPPTRPLEYEVFLSFRGFDTRKGFTDHLYKALIRNGIHTFRDDEQLKSGKPISKELLKAIEESKISVIILSTNYATSTWCLDELAKMVELANNESRLILPVFYNVTPSEVREQTGDHFKKAFAQHDKDFEGEPGKVARWKNSLTAIAELEAEGFDLTNFRYETDMIEKIVERIFGVLIQTFSNDDLKDFVGMDRVNEIKSKMSLCMGSEEVRVIGICGMPGIGKSTVAKALSQRIRSQFDATSFISKVGEISKKKGLFHVKKQLCDHLLDKKVTTKDVDDVICKRLRDKRVLIILDNVDELEQIKAVAGTDGADLSNRFGKGSRIIVTTTDERLLIYYNHPEIYTIEKLTSDQALLLFCRKALETDHPTDAFKKLSNEFVDYIDGHPLALEVFGRSLRDRKEDYWSTKLKSLKDNNYSGEEKIIGVLKASFDGLENQEQKDMFLDTACFFKGEDVCRLEKIFESCGYYPSINIDILCEKYLVSMVGGKLWMHDLLQKMGRDIVRGESKKEGERSRLWHHTVALPVLRKNKGTKTVEGIFLSSPQPDKVHLKKDPFSNMDNLRLLKIYNVEFSGCLEYLSDELSLLEWHKCPFKSLPSSFEPDKLVELNLSESEIEELWEEIERPLEKLAVLNLSDCQKLIKTPDFDKVPNLEQLILKGCTSLSAVPNDINLRSLTNFILSGCSKLKKLPEIGEDMKQLRKLHLDGTAIEELPTSIKHLTGLILLNLRDCKNLLSLPDVIGTSLTSLQILNVSGCSNLNELPENLGSLECLQELYASRTAIQELPTSIKHLTDLTLLNLRECKNLLTLPDVICTNLTSLQILNLSGCSNLNELPENLGSLECLQELYASGTAISQVPESMSQLSQLEELVLDGCSKLQSLPALPFSIRAISVHNCPLLQGSHSNKITVWPSAAAGFSFLNRQRQHDMAQAFWLPDKHLLWPFYQTFFEGAIRRDERFEYGYRSNEIPAWLSRRSTESTITIPLPHDVDGKSKWIKLALCFICEAAQKHDSLEDVPEFDEELGVKFTRIHRIELYTTEDPHEHLLALDYRDCNFAGPFIHWCFIAQSDLAESTNKRLIQATITPDSPGTKITGCGASLIYLEDVPKFVRKLNKHYSYCYQGYQPEQEEDGMRSIPSTSGVQTEQEVQEQETTTSTRIVGQLRRNVESLLEKLFEGLQQGLPKLYDYGFIFCLRERLLWFSEQSSTSACTVNLRLPPNLHNDEKWAGLSLYVVYALPPGLPRSRNLYECYLNTPIEAVGHEQLMHRLGLVSLWDDTVGSHRLLIIHIPRVRFPERLNRCHFVQALFGCRTPGVQVEMCGMRLVYKQDLKALIQTIAHCTNDRPAYYGTGDFTETRKYKGISLGATSLLTNLVEAAKSSEHSSVSSVCPPFMPIDFRPEPYNEYSQHERKTTPIHPLQYFGNAFYPTNKMSSDQNQLLDFERDLKYNSCFPPNEIVEWFGHQSSGPSVKIPLPSNLCEDTNWIGLALCAYFSVLDHSTTDLDNLNPEISHNLTCLLETDESCLESLHGYCTNSQEFKWLYHMGGFIWLSYIPRCWFSDQLKEQGHLEASIGSDRGSLGVHRCGLRLIYLEDEEGLKETIMHCMTSLSDINEGKDEQYKNCEAGSSSITGSNIVNPVNPHLERSEEPNDKKWNFGCHTMYNSCFPSSITLEWFGDQSSGSSIRVPLPPHLYRATNWIGLALCTSFSIVDNPTADLDNLNPEISHHLICHLESDRGTIEPLHDYCTTNEEFQWLPFGGFIWVSYIPRAWFSDQLNECDVLEASFASDHEAFTVHECGLRLVYQHDEEEIKQTILHYMTSLSDKKGKNKQCPTGDAGSSSRPSSYIVKPHLERLGRPSDEKWDFDRHSIYNSCFPSSITLEWFGHQSNDSSATISLPHNLNLDSNWIGLAVCAYFSVLEHPTVDIDNLDIPAISHHLICNLESDRDSLESLHDYCTTNEEFLWLHLGGFVWVSYIPRAWFSDQLNECGVLEASIASDHEAFSVQKCGLRLVYQHDEEEFKQTISRSQIRKGKISNTLTAR
ncbi:PREDICTED: disease resistance protein RPS6-like [Prunus mume]|uniref:ADP-ribosyl cyclase/cyclic ADP-ribose hydrolase n=1 Tax=Prunus mume TaxID=102107 RepID=A0ABM0PKE7_PRUMU|nr:PREDICTED: disease resistance protein RPS6-like [Prunus mume]